MPQIEYGPSVVVSRDGSRTIELIQFLGTERVSNRDASAFTFLVRTVPEGEPFRLSVVFSGTTLSYGQPLKAFGLPAEGNRVLEFLYFAEARIGDYMDEEGTPVPPEAGYYAVNIECMSDRFDEWEARGPADEDTIEEYVRGRLFWAWKFDHEAVAFRQPDFIRLRLNQTAFARTIQLGTDRDWTVGFGKPLGIFVTPTRDFIKAERDRRKNVGSRQGAHARKQAAPFVDEERLEQLRAIEHPDYDLAKLVALCGELNSAAESDAVFAIAMITRAIIDHVPPIFGASKFSEVASNYAGSKSFKESMGHLAMSARKIADAHLHVQIRERETLPTRTQVDFSRDLDVLLGEIVRILGSRSRPA